MASADEHDIKSEIQLLHLKRSCISLASQCPEMLAVLSMFAEIQTVHVPLCGIPWLCHTCTLFLL